MSVLGDSLASGAGSKELANSGVVANAAAPLSRSKYENNHRAIQDQNG
jgi:hypothetical protein